ncbi:cutinase family protein [Nocardia sp. BSTN01]|uniref:cutinase family protein n=1 Tax=Nocardia sp. BSTN01 TaxID=2783665 RepID=UPI001E3D77F0|nr:cutinase family protein [Nocardia sp. BSTN01]
METLCARPAPPEGLGGNLEVRRLGSPDPGRGSNVRSASVPARSAEETAQMALFDRERPRHVRGMAGASAVASIAVTPAVVGISAATPAAAQTTCADVDVVVARGTGEPLGDGPGLGAVVGDPVYHALAQRLSISHSAYRVRYPAGLAQPWSVQQGNRDLLNHVTGAAKACPNQRFVLVGYSQRANVVDNSIGISSVGAKVGGPILATLPVSVGAEDRRDSVVRQPIRGIGHSVTGPYGSRTSTPAPRTTRSAIRRARVGKCTGPATPWRPARRRTSPSGICDTLCEKRKALGPWGRYRRIRQAMCQLAFRTENHPPNRIRCGSAGG